MRRAAVVAIALLVGAVSITASVRKTDGMNADRKMHIALILQMKQGDYWNTIKMGAEVAAKEFGIELAFHAPDIEGDVSGQNELVDLAIRSRADAIVLAASDYKALDKAVERADNARIPVIAIDSEVESDKVASFIGTNNYEAGRQAGNELIGTVGDKGRIAVIGFATGSRNGEERERGLLDVLAGHPGIEIVTKAYSSADAHDAERLSSGILDKYGTINGIVALNSEAAVGAANTIKRKGLSQQVKVIAFDNTYEELELLQEGVIQATIIQNPFSMGYLGVEHAVGALRGSAMEERVETGTKAIDLENMFWLDNQKLLFPFVK